MGMGMVGRGFCEAEDREDGRVLLIHFVQWRLVGFSMCERVGSINDLERVEREEHPLQCLGEVAEKGVPLRNEGCVHHKWVFSDRGVSGDDLGAVDMHHGSRDHRKRSQPLQERCTALQPPEAMAFGINPSNNRQAIILGWRAQMAACSGDATARLETVAGMGISSGSDNQKEQSGFAA
jgi:hypothetical protein